MLSKFINILSEQNSTRSVALIRIGIVLLLWARFSRYLVPFKGIPFEQVLIGIVFFVSSLFTFIGLWTNLSIGILAITTVLIYLYVGFSLGVEPLTHHHTYLLCVTPVFLFFTSCGNSISLDRYLKIKKALKKNTIIPDESGIVWGRYLIALQLTSIYLWSTYSKLIPGFISGDRMEQIFLYYYYNIDFYHYSLFPFFMCILSIGTIVIELVLAFGLWINKVQKYVIVLGVFFHLILFYLLPVVTFSLTMILLYLAFIPPQKVHELIDMLFVCEKK